MDRIQIISRLSGLDDADRAMDEAVRFTVGGADALFAELTDETQLDTIKALNRSIDTPLVIGMKPKRFEDVKKVFYAGATYVCISEASDEVEKEVTGRFGEKKVLHPKDFLEIKAPSESKEVAEKGQVRVILSGDGASLATEVKKALRSLGLSVNTFESAIPFSEFKLNADGMIPVIVQDYKTAEVLMLAYMNEEAYEKTIETATMHYYSRSRNELWLKGETSGHYQYVKEIFIDCDNDTLLAKVEQIGAACHTGNRSCFYRTLAKKEYNDTNPLTILREDFDVIKKRKEEPKEDSYTNYLFDKGIDKILKKVGEEATEIVIAAKNPNAEELRYEIADFLYHMMVLMVECGLSWEDITQELKDRR